MATAVQLTSAVQRHDKQQPLTSAHLLIMAPASFQQTTAATSLSTAEMHDQQQQLTSAHLLIMASPWRCTSLAQASSRIG